MLSRTELRQLYWLDGATHCDHLFVAFVAGFQPILVTFLVPIIMTSLVPILVPIVMTLLVTLIAPENAGSVDPHPAHSRLARGLKIAVLPAALTPLGRGG